MPNEFDNVPRAELAADLKKYFFPPAPTVEHNPPGVTADMSQQAKDTASKLYLDSIMAKPAGALTPEEHAFLRGNIEACLRDLGY